MGSNPTDRTKIKHLQAHVFLTHGSFLYFRNTTRDFLHDWTVAEYKLRHTKERLLCTLEKENKVVNCKQFVK